MIIHIKAAIKRMAFVHSRDVHQGQNKIIVKTYSTIGGKLTGFKLVIDSDS